MPSMDAPLAKAVLPTTTGTVPDVPTANIKLWVPAFRISIIRQTAGIGRAVKICPSVE